MSSLRIKLIGTTTLVCHNIRLADPDDPIAVQIAAITGKRKKTPEDRKDIARLEWFGGLYFSNPPNGPVMPTANIKRCFVEAAKVQRLGTAVTRALHCHAIDTPIIYDGPRDTEKLCALPKHHYRTSVGIQNSRTMRTRPCFPQWELEIEVELVENALSLEDFVAMAKLAGVIEGLGDNRINGYGRFGAEVTRND